MNEIVLEDTQYSDSKEQIAQEQNENQNNNKNSKLKSVKFNKVDLYYFDRSQGFLSIPSSDNERNSITLGMSYLHTDHELFETQDEFLKYKRKLDLQKIESYLSKNLHESEEENRLLFLTDPNLTSLKQILDNKELYEQNIETDLNISPDILCPILTLEERLQKLEKFGIQTQDLDKTESDDINCIRESRKECGCNCNKLNMVCGENGDLCSCFANGIQCQLDRVKFPCNCTIKKCNNQFGMKRFNQKLVIEHYKLKLYPNLLKNNNQIKQKSRKRKSKSVKPNSKRKKSESENEITNEESE